MATNEFCHEIMQRFSTMILMISYHIITRYTCSSRPYGTFPQMPLLDWPITRIIFFSCNDLVVLDLQSGKMHLTWLRL